jgi:hypothetical protein
LAPRLAHNQEATGSNPVPATMASCAPGPIQTAKRGNSFRCPLTANERTVNPRLLVRIQVPERKSHGPVGESGRPRHPVKVKTAGSNPVRTAQGRVAQMARAPARHAGGRPFEPGRGYSSSRGEADITARYGRASRGSSPLGSAQGRLAQRKSVAFTPRRPGFNSLADYRVVTQTVAGPACGAGISGFDSRTTLLRLLLRSPNVRQLSHEPGEPCVGMQAVKAAWL